MTAQETVNAPSMAPYVRLVLQGKHRFMHRRCLKGYLDRGVVPAAAPCALLWVRPNQTPCPGCGH